MGPEEGGRDVTGPARTLLFSRPAPPAVSCAAWSESGGRAASDLEESTGTRLDMRGAGRGLVRQRQADAPHTSAGHVDTRVWVARPSGPCPEGPRGDRRTAPPPLRSLQVWAWPRCRVGQELQFPESCRPALGTQAKGMVHSWLKVTLEGGARVPLGASWGSGSGGRPARQRGLRSAGLTSGVLEWGRNLLHLAFQGAEGRLSAAAAPVSQEHPPQPASDLGPRLQPGEPRLSRRVLSTPPAAFAVS